MSPVSVLQVALPVPLPRLFDYLPPIGQAASPGDVGKRVSVMFGNRPLTGFVAGVGPPADPGLDLRPADALLDAAPLLHGELLESLHWLARYTHAPPGEVVATALPVLLRQGEPLPDTHAWHWRLTEAGLSGRERLRAGSRPRRLADLLAQHGTLDEDVLDLHLDTGRATARDLGKRGLAERFAAPPAAVAASPRPGPALNDEQQAAADLQRHIPQQCGNGERAQAGAMSRVAGALVPFTLKPDEHADPQCHRSTRKIEYFTHDVACPAGLLRTALCLTQRVHTRLATPTRRALTGSVNNV